MDEDWVDDGITLWMDCGEFALRPGWWHAILGLARKHGWCPQGTQPPRDYHWDWDGNPTAWDGRYWPGFGQQVTDEDARNLGTALARALPDIPDHFRPVTGAKDPDVNALELLSGTESKKILGWLLEHCDGCCGGGGFDICDF
jgi:hypothetical protein